MNPTDKIEATLKRANIAFTIFDLPDEFGSETHESIRKKLEENNANVYDYICKLLLICGRLEEALTYVLETHNIDATQSVVYEEPTARDGSMFYCDAEEITDEVISMMNQQ